MQNDTSAYAAAAFPDLGDWVEVNREVCRGDRVLFTAVNHRTRTAIEFEQHDLSSTSASDGLRDDLRDSGFLADRAPDPVHGGLPLARRLARFVRTLDISVGNADRQVQRLYRNRLHHLFRPRAVAAQVVLAVLGAVAATLALSSRGPVDLSVDAHLVPVFLALGVLAVAVHELAHALVVAHYGRSIDTFGFRLHLATPAFYVESVEALLLTRRQRMLQAAAGPWAEWLFTSLAAIVLLLVPDGTGIDSVLHRFVALNIVNVVSNLLPFVNLDGSLLLADGIRVPDLSRRARGAVGGLVEKVAHRRRPTIGDAGLAAYSIANAAVATGLVALSLFLWIEMFGDLVATLYHHGPLGVLTLAIVGGVLLRPALAVIVPRLGDALCTAERVAHDLRFRRSIPWRRAAVEQLRRIDDQIATMTAGQLGLLAGLLQPVRRGTPDPLDWAVVEVAAGRGVARPVRAAISRRDIHRLQLVGG